jgi:hypothetical protein
MTATTKIAYNLLAERFCSRCVYTQHVGFKTMWCVRYGKFKEQGSTCTEWKSGTRWIKK